MKKLIVSLLALLLMASLAYGALAAYQGTMYVNRSSVNVYKEDNTNSKVIKKYKGGRAVYVDDISPNGKWAQTLIEDTKHGGQMLGFIQTKYLSEKMPPEYCKHEWGKWKVTKEATCTEKGKRERTCKICGKKQTETIKATGHSWNKWKVTKEATCVDKGSRTRTCKVCGERETEQFYAEHTWGAWRMTKEPTCTEKGERERKCKVCGKVSTQALDKLPHDYEWEVIVETTDHSAGTRAKICKVCGHDGGEESFDPEGTLRRGDRGDAVRRMQQLLVEQGYLNANGADGIFGGGSEKALIQYQKDRNLNPDGIGWPQTLKDLEHDFGPWEIVKEMTRTEAGERRRVCQGCGFEQTEVIEAGTTFERGRRGDDIRAMQQLLNALGYNAGGVDGIYGKKLDAALAAFAAERELVVEDGKVRPADVDAVFNEWLQTVSADKWKGEGDTASAVNLALTVTPSSDADDTGIQTYSWSLTNMGNTDANFTALLLTFGDTPDFKADNLVMQLDGYTMKKNSGNSVSGTFSVDASWGEGNLNFAGLAVDEKTGDIWLSNAVEFDNSTEPATKTVAPQTVEVDVNALPDGEYPVAFNRGDILSGATGIYMNAVHIFSMDIYDIVDVNTLTAGDTLVVSGEEIPVTSVERSDSEVLVNGGLEAENGVVLGPIDEDTNGYRVWLESDMATFTELGATTLVLADNAEFNDSWNIDAEPVKVSHDGIVSAIAESDNDYFNQYNTSIRVEDGKVVEIKRVYVP
ncbi:MAG: peptidoglycan-binding protein [Clostridia bacterium]|nr:peptidoglycan-binding protein [Clostridia bacterium]